MNSSASQSAADEYVQRVVRADVRTMAAYHVPSSSGLIKLDAMENPYRLPESLRAELAARLADVSVNRYPQPAYTELKQSIRERLGVPQGHELVLGNGSDELITMLSVATATGNACIVSPIPSFVMYEMSARLAGSRFVGVPLNPDFSLDQSAMLAAIAEHRPSVVYLAYPNNPTGNSFDDATIEAILRASTGVVVVDEAYQPFAERSWMPRLAQYPNLIVMRTVSKLGLAGIRLGYLAAAPAWTDELEKVRPPYNINVLTEVAARFALDHLDLLDQQAAQIRADRQHLSEALSALPGVEVFASQANFVLARFSNGPAIWRGLLDRGLLVKDVGKMHPLLTGCLRLTVGTELENDALINALSQVLSQ